jgi:hypothetical protein
MNVLYLVAHRFSISHDDGILPRAEVVASITIDPRFIGRMDADQALRVLAGKMGLTSFDIEDGEVQSRPGMQLELHLRHG